MIYYFDTFFIFFYRVFSTPIFGYLFGTFCLSIFCVLFGQITQNLLWRWNHQWIRRDNREMVRMHNLSLKALSFKDKAAYKACNKEANDAFGKFFFAQMAMGMSSLWPVPFALAWMDTRFTTVDFFLPGIGPVGYMASFVPIFILANIIFSKVKKRIPFFASMARRISKDTDGIGKMMTLGELLPDNGGEQNSKAGFCEK